MKKKFVVTIILVGIAIFVIGCGGEDEHLEYPLAVHETEAEYAEIVEETGEMEEIEESDGDDFEARKEIAWSVLVDHMAGHGVDLENSLEQEPIFTDFRNTEDAESEARRWITEYGVTEEQSVLMYEGSVVIEGIVYIGGGNTRTFKSIVGVLEGYAPGVLSLEFN